MRLAAKWRTSWVMNSHDVERTTQSLRMGGERIEVVRLGRGEPLVLVPGLAGSWKLLLPLARRLAQHFEVITYGLRGDDSPGNGLGATRGHARDIGEYAQDLASLIDQLGLECPAVFGVSFGGAVALELAAECPGRLGALVVHGAEARFRPTLGSTIARRVLERFPLPADSRFVNQFFHLLYGTKPEPGPSVDFVIDRIWETDQSVMAERLALLESFDISNRLWRIEVPALILAGARDVIVPAIRQQALANGVSGARFGLIENAGHIGFLTHCDEVVRHVRRHLNRLRAPV
jgi:pimeloyl-[acyl-carrier protein] methyl ester esterase